MELETFSVIAQIVSSIAIVATLAYLAVQSKQTNNMLLGDSRQASMEAEMTLLANIISNPEIANRILGNSQEHMQNQALLIMFMRTREFQWFQYKAGTLDRETFRSYMSPIGDWLRSEVSTSFWSRFKGGFDPAFVTFVDEMIGRQSA